MSNNSSRAIVRMAWRHAWRRPLQSAFLVIGVAIGVAMVVAIDLANGSAQRAFDLGTESVTGRATHQILGGPNGVEESIYTELRRELGYRLSAPVVEEYVVAPELDGQPMRLLGVDLFSENPFRNYLGTGAAGETPGYLADFMARPNSVLVSTVIAGQYGLQTGDSLTVSVGGQNRTLTIVGLLEPSDELSRRALDSLLVSDISTAQEVLDRVGRLSRIDLIVPAGSAGEADLARIAAMLPTGVRIEESAARRGTVNEMTAAFELNLTALSLLALVVGMFLIYNTVTFSVVQRRPVLGSLRALGMTRREIFALILTEAGVLGALGTVAGLALGLVLGRGAVQLVTRTVNDLFFVVAVRDLETPVWALVKGAVIGICAALVGAGLPALEATSVPPAGAFQRSNMEERARRALPWVSGAAIVLLGVGALLLIPEGYLVVSFIGLFAIIIGSALLAPLLTLALMTALRTLLGERANVIERMAPRYVIRSLSRSSVAVAALMVAVSVIIGVGIMIGSFRETVARWLDDVLQADIFVSAPSLSANQVLTTVDDALVAQLADFPGIARMVTTRAVDVTAFLEGAQSGPVATGTRTIRLAAVSEDLAGPKRRYRAAVGDWQATWQALAAGGVMINEPMANRFGLAVGDMLTLQSDRGLHAFPIVGVAIDYDVNAVAFVHDPVYRQFWDDREISAVALFVEPGVDVDTKVTEIRMAFGGEANLLVRSNRGTRENALDVFDRTFSITVALQLLATVVAFIGILSTLMSLQLERTHEIGVLRSTGMTRRQLWRLSLLETGLLGSCAGLFAIPTGIGLAAILIYIINLRSFGWTLEMLLLPWELARAFGVALGAALLAGIYPAWRMGQIPPAIALRAE